MSSIGAERELDDGIVGRLWPGKSAQLGACCRVPDHDGVAISAGREPLAVGAERERLKTPIVDCGKRLVRRARPWRDLWRGDFFPGHGKLRYSRRRLLCRLLSKHRKSTGRQGKTEEYENFYKSMQHLLAPNRMAQERQQSALSLSTRASQTRCNFRVEGAKCLINSKTAETRGQPNGNCTSGQVAGVFQGGTLRNTALLLRLNWGKA